MQAFYVFAFVIHCHDISYKDGFTNNGDVPTT